MNARPVLNGQVLTRIFCMFPIFFFNLCLCHLQKHNTYQEQHHHLYYIRKYSRIANQWHHRQKNSSLNCFENYAYFTNHYSSKYTHKHTKSNSFRTFRDKDHHLSNYIKVSTLDINKLFQKNRFFQY